MKRISLPSGLANCELTPLAGDSGALKLLSQVITYISSALSNDSIDTFVITLDPSLPEDDPDIVILCPTEGVIDSPEVDIENWFDIKFILFKIPLNDTGPIWSTTSGDPILVNVPGNGFTQK